MTRWAVVLAGGVGSRFWPLSTEKQPKQLLPLIAKKPLLVEQLERLRLVAPPARTLVLTNASLVSAIARAAPRVPRKNIIAATHLNWPGHTVADWAIGDPEGFRDALATAATAAETHHSLVTVGIIPTRPDPGFGYIEPGQQLSPGVRRAMRFVEKPSREQAAQMRDQGYLWNSGIFVWRVGDFLDEVRALSPEVGPALAKHAKSLATKLNARLGLHWL